MQQVGSSSASPEAEWRRRRESGRLSFQRCRACCAAIFYPRAICTHCGSQDLIFCDSAGVGRVESFTMIARPGDPGAESVVALAIVQLDEGIKLMAKLVDPPDGDIIGMTAVLVPKARLHDDFPSFRIKT
ncbi:Zn-ribbon domain-containing OB-fold protein [Rhodopseudomonas rhenobacensis]|nr:OB-fold domain-containing protein [Rhodopseudomonas rhenobacensis]